MLHGSLFAALSADRSTPAFARPQIYTRQTMLALSHAIEDQALVESPVRLLVALFQQGVNVSRQAERYRRLARHCERVVVAGFDLPALHLPGVEMLALPAGSPLRDEWAILVVGDGYQALLSTREAVARADGFGESYGGMWSFNRDAVRAGATRLALVLAGVGGLDTSDWPALVPVSGSSSAAAEAGAARMLAFVERNAQRVRTREQELRQALLQVEQTNLEMVSRLAVAAEQKDTDTGEHLWRVAAYTELVARALGHAGAEVDLVARAAPMHDIGKVQVDDAVLRKPGKLTEEEFAAIKLHTTAGDLILTGSPSPLIQTAARIARSHHEKWDGSGYPDGLRGRLIPWEARVVAVGDVFDALTSRRPYKEPFPLDRALSIIREERGRHFDPDVVDAFLAMEREVRRIAEAGDDGSRFRWHAGLLTPATSDHAVAGVPVLRAVT